MEKVILAKNIAYSYGGKFAVDHISFHIGKGEILGFLGPNGAGKTTTIKMLIGLLALREGTINILGMDISKDIKKIKSQIGVCFEEKNLYEEMSAMENLKFFASLFGAERIDPVSLLERVGLENQKKKKVADYSKGMKQRLMIARALVNRPKVIILDEPTDGLDPTSSKAIRKIILEEKERGATIFLTTHDMMEADKLSDRVAFISEGKIVSLDTPENLKHQYGKRILKIRYKEGGSLREEELPLEGAEIKKRTQEILSQGRVVDMHTEEATLEDIFIQLTGTKL